jgi:NADH:ubiquinone oxidoreductase subunit 6 (subunit J)
MSLPAVIMYFFALVTVLSAIAIFLAKNIFNAALALLLCLLCIAALFVLNYAEFLGVAQILLYAGGVVVIIIFGIMLTSKRSSTSALIGNGRMVAGISTAGALFFLLVFFVHKSIFVTPALATDSNNLQTIGVSLLTTYVVPFEIAGVLLLAVLVGAAVLAGYKPNKPNA